MYRQAPQITGIDQGALENGDKCTFGHGVVNHATCFSAFSENGAFQGRILESEDNLILTRGNYLLVYVVERVIPKQGAISNGHSQEETGIVVEQLFVFFCRRPEAGMNRSVSACQRMKGGLATWIHLRDVIWITVVFHPTLVDLVCESPATTIFTVVVTL